MSDLFSNSEIDSFFMDEYSQPSMNMVLYGASLRNSTMISKEAVATTDAMIKAHVDADDFQQITENQARKAKEEKRKIREQKEAEDRKKLADWQDRMSSGSSGDW